MPHFHHPRSPRAILTPPKVTSNFQALDKKKEEEEEEQTMEKKKGGLKGGPLGRQNKRWGTKQRN